MADSSLVLPPSSLRLTADRGALAANWVALDAVSGGAKAGAAVKADCYGLGIDACVPVLRDAGCETFFVAHWSEVAAVSAHVPPAQVAVLHGVLNEAECAYARATGAVPVINSLEQAALWQAGGGGPCHLMIDTGINRLGIAPSDANQEIISSLDIDILMSHLASADEDSPMNPRQLDAFRAARGTIAHRRASLANSAGIALGKDYAFDLTRPGIALYGGVPRGELSDMIRPVAQVEAAILQTRTLEAGESVGYNGTFTASTSMKVGTVSVGYADGFLRMRGPGNACFHNGRRLPILGKVSMDMVVVDLAAAPDLAAGDWLTVPWDINAAAPQNGLSAYEMLTSIGKRLRCN
ncbi:alanine racemase [Porphyrobacter sp. AAP60]|uniref:alanine racemase n=1 Tax=Porphyrobacter sp. AAP60 TaxID=1523423 RepID=UPI0006B9253D|nr:alanine racemase [Porphyrobacter sp. AAP60]KPF65199.1 alanine racemase [Porphyrobacter sp. AAP60]